MQFGTKHIILGVNVKNITIPLLPNINCYVYTYLYMYTYFNLQIWVNIHGPYRIVRPELDKHTHL